MNIVDGNLPQGIEWRVMIVLEPGQLPGIAWQLGRSLARANRGDLVVAIVVSPDDNRESVATAISDAASFRHKEQNKNGANVYAVVVENRHIDSALFDLVKAANIDLLMMIATRPDRFDFRQLPCSVALLRLVEPASNPIAAEMAEVKKVLVPTSGGPNSIYALSLMMLLGPDIETTAFYAVIDGKGDNEEALGHERLRQALDFVHADNKIRTQIGVYESIAAGIVEETGKDYDLVVIGATEESRLDRVIFGNIPAVVVEKTERPVMILRQRKSRLGNAVTAIDWRLQTVFPQKTISERAAIYARIRRDARPKTPFFVLITLSAIIAGFGLIVGSPAVVIGAMLVAPLMSPIIGTGLAIVLGDARFLRLALGAVNRGVLLAILVGMLTGLTALNMPFSDEILARTQPNLYDLAIALFSGAAAAYALSFSQAAGALPGVAIAAALVPPLATVGITLVAGLAALLSGHTADGWEYLEDSLGALLLFTTNFIAISTAASFVFFILGFRPTPSKKARREVQRRSTALALALLMVVTAILGVTSYLLARETTIDSRIYTITESQIEETLGARLANVDIIERRNDHLNLGLTVISPRAVPHNEVVELQEQLAEAFEAAGIAGDLALTMSVIRVTELDPLVPPTSTPEPASATGPTAP